MAFWPVLLGIVLVEEWEVAVVERMEAEEETEEIVEALSMADMELVIEAETVESPKIVIWIKFYMLNKV